MGFVGLPVWWVLGLVHIMLLAMTIPMAAYLLRRRPVVAPRGTAIWLLFLIWIAAGVFVLQVDAPGAIPGVSMSRYPTFAYRMSWYLAGTIALLYIANTRHLLSRERIASALAATFVIVTAGGWLGLLFPRFELTTAVEMILPNRIALNPFVHSLVHARAAQVQEFLGRPQPRPSAPLAYTNDWGLMMAMTLPFFILMSWRRSRRWQWVTVLMLLVALVPIVASLNRGLWMAIAAMATMAAVRSVMLGNLRILIGVLGAGVVALVLVLATPLGGLVTERLDNPHSNEVRTNLGTLSAASALEGSPVIGFGTTRDVPGNFNSISGGATAECPKCSPPPLGTQGHLWLLTFGGGIGAVLLFCGFFGHQMLRHWRDPSPYALAGLCALVAMFVTMPVYDSFGLRTLIALIAVGLLDRCRPSDGKPIGELLSLPRRNLAIVIMATIIGLAGGAAVGRTNPLPAFGTQSVLLPFDDLVGIPGARPLSLDSEAQLATSEPVLRAIADRLGLDDLNQPAERLTITAEPNTRILNLHYRAADTATARTATETASAAYIGLRKEMIGEAQDRLITRLEQRQAQLAKIYDDLGLLTGRLGSGDSNALSETALAIRTEARQVGAEIAALEAPQGSPGEVIAPPEVTTSSGAMVIAVASGGTLGLVAGLVMASVIDGRLARRRGQRWWATERILVGLSTGSAQSAVHAIAPYAPLAGAVPDRRVEACCGLARRIDDLFAANGNLSGRRVVLVVSPRSPRRRVQQLRRSCRRRGLEPIGIVLASDVPHSDETGAS